MEYRAGDVPTQRREQIVREAIEIMQSFAKRVSERVANMDRFLQQLEVKARRYTAILRE